MAFEVFTAAVPELTATDGGGVVEPTDPIVVAIAGCATAITGINVGAAAAGTAGAAARITLFTAAIAELPAVDHDGAIELTDRGATAGCTVALLETATDELGD